MGQNLLNRVRHHPSFKRKYAHLLFSLSLALVGVFAWVNVCTAPLPVKALATARINEFVLDHSGSDTHEYVEIFGDPETDYSAYTLLQIEGDSSAGAIDGVYPLGATDAGGLWSTGFLSGEFENGSLTLLLVEGFSGSLGADLDLDDDGVLDISPWTLLIDAVGVSDGDPGDLNYAAIVLGPGFDGLLSKPGGASYFSTGWLRNDYDGAGLPGFGPGTPDYGEAYNTPLAENLAVPGPDNLILFAEGPDWLVPAETISYTLFIHVSGSLTATEIVLTDTLPGGLSYLSDDSGVTPDNPSPGTYVWQLGDLPPGSDMQIQITATADLANPGETLSNQAQVSASLAGDDPIDNTASTFSDVIELVLIQAIQTVADPANEDASPYSGMTVAAGGIVTAEPGDIDTGTTTFVIQDPGGGSWSGLTVVSPDGFPGLSAPVGSSVRVRGAVEEYFGFTRLVVPDGVAGVKLLSTAVNPTTPQLLASADYTTASSAEMWESVLIAFKNASVTIPDLGFGEWGFDDGSGMARADDLGESDGDLNYKPALGDVYEFIRGIGWFSFGDYKLTPRSDVDIQLANSRPYISKSSPAQVLPGGLFTYTLTTMNELSYNLLNVVITDALPSGTTFAFSSDGGVHAGGIVTWNLGELPPGTGALVSYAANAPVSSGLITNTNYAISAANYVTPTFGAPVQTYIGDEIHIHHLQGVGDASPFEGRTVSSVDGVVTGVMNRGFFMQDPAPDANAHTSEGIFVYTGAAPAVAVGDGVSVDGTVLEDGTHTTLASTNVVTHTTSAAIAPTPVELPVTVSLEPFEGMLVSFAETLTVSQNYFLGRYGQATLSAEGRLFNPTNGNGLGDTPEYNTRRTIFVDDNTTAENVGPIPYIGLENTLRAGDNITGLTGVIDFGRIDSDGGAFYRLQPGKPLSFTRSNPRTSEPGEVPGSIKVASFNVLNYFNGDGAGGGFPTSRGADTYAEFLRQRTKIISAMLSIDADIFGLIEIENDGDGTASAIQDLVSGLNAVAGADKFSAIADPDFTGVDAIKVALIYKPSELTPVGASRTSTDSLFSRPPIAQMFEHNASGERFTVVVNHFKSKSSCPASPLDPNADQGDGQGCWNALREAQAQALLTFIEALKGESGDDDVLVIGDLNSYGQEDPILALQAGGLINQISKYVPAEQRYSYVFDGMAGYLDHALASSHMSAQVLGVTIWHINADEPSVIDYNTESKSQDLYTPTPYRSSDHDPVIIGLELSAAPFRVRLPLVIQEYTMP